MLTGAIIGCVVAFVVLMMNKRTAKAGTGLPGKIETILRGAGPHTLGQVATKVGLDSFMGRGKVVQALSALQSVGKVRMTPAPAGTPQLEKVKVVTYEVISS